MYQEGFWEDSWYSRGDGSFESADVPVVVDVQSGRTVTVKVGFLICSELWFFQHARGYGEQGVHVILSP